MNSAQCKKDMQTGFLASMAKTKSQCTKHENENEGTGEEVTCTGFSITLFSFLV